MFSVREIEWEDYNEQGLPPGFRFHPTDEELITFYLASKVFNGSFCGVEIAELDLNRCEPWELPDTAKMGEREWYFFSLRDRKYPTGLRTNRATEAGYWKATGKDREVYGAHNGALLGMKKTLVFYKGRAPRGEKTKWVMHEYRLDGDFSCRHACKEEWVICRIFHKTGGEKKNPFIQNHTHFLQSSSTPTSNLPPLLESPLASSLGSLQSSHMIPPESNLKSLLNPLSQTSNLIPMTFQPFSLTNPSVPSLSNQCLLKETSVLKQCKIENQISNIQPEESNYDLFDKNQQIHENQLIFEMGCGYFGISSSSAGVHELATSSAFSRPNFPILKSSPITDLGESGPLEL